MILKINLPIEEIEMVFLMRDVHRAFSESDGVIHATHSLYEKETLEKWSEWLAPRPVISVGPISPPVTKRDIELERTKSPISEEVLTFLDYCLATHGPHSVIFVGPAKLLRYGSSY